MAIPIARDSRTIEICVGYEKLNSRRDLTGFKDKINYSIEALKLTPIYMYFL